MTNYYKSLIGLCIVAASLAASAQSADEHKGHHPAGTPDAPAMAQKPKAGGMDAGSMGMMQEQHMKAMQAMHEKMVAAKTPEERQALMTEHMKLMQDGMAMMKQMSGGKPGMGGMAADKTKGAGQMDRQKMMEKRMDMMESMMQMMMDRMPAESAK